jgi:hypothetical protein
VYCLLTRKKKAVQVHSLLRHFHNFRLARYPITILWRPWMIGCKRGHFRLPDPDLLSYRSSLAKPAGFSGHGVSAALSASMVKVAIRAQSEHVRNPAEVLAGLNSILYENLQGQFGTAAYVFIFASRARQCKSGGCPAPE